MKTQLDIEKWTRHNHFEFFKQFEEPFFGICVDIDCTKSYAKCKSEGISFFLYYLYKSLVAANKIEPFRYRIENENVFIYDKVLASPTIDRPDGTFGFSRIDYYEDFQMFNLEAKKVIEKVRNSKELFPAVSDENVIHYSSLPWINFKSVSHARSFSFKDSCPKITFGKISEHDNVKKMPISIHVHHALMDGIHVGQFIDEFQNQMI
ncbi:MAG: chloramphenicol acetyltransferase [Bacteroidales bacterium]|nr:chloramphenicol acetyltransferase [Bacteroidales bacterium]